MISGGMISFFSSKKMPNITDISNSVDHYYTIYIYTTTTTTSAFDIN